MTETERIIESVLEEHADVWEALAKGNTAIEREVAYVLRSVVAEIEGPEPANRDSIREALRWCLDVLGARRPLKAVTTVSDPGLTDSTTWVPDDGWQAYSTSVAIEGVNTGYVQ